MKPAKTHTVKYRKSGSKTWKTIEVDEITSKSSGLQELDIEIIAENLNLNGDYDFSYNGKEMKVEIMTRVETIYEAIIKE